MSASNHPWPVSIYGTPQRNDERSKPFLSFSLLLSFFTALRLRFAASSSVVPSCKVLTQEQDQQIFFFSSLLSSGNLSSRASVRPSSSYRIFMLCA
jgi:hypothetical protein